MVRMMSPGRMSGVTPSQQPPPGWLTSTIPANGAPGAARGSACGMTVDVLATMSPPATSDWRSTWTWTVSVARKPLLDTKSRDGNEMICTGATGGSLTVTPAGTVARLAAVVTVMGVDCGERLPT